MSVSSTNVLSASSVESRRFGLRVARGVLAGNEPPDAILTDIKALRPDLAIFRCAAGDVSQISSLSSIGLTPIHADTLVYYGIPLDRGRPQQGQPVPEIRVAEPTDNGAISSIIRGSFSDYRNHYHANPRLSREAILDGYVEWALDSTDRTAETQRTWVFCTEGKLASFATCRKCRGTIEIILNATAREWAGRGFYSQLLRFLIEHYGDVGYSRLLISTQIWNYNVQRIWTRAGMTIDRAYDTYHINIPKEFWDNTP